MPPVKEDDRKRGTTMLRNILSIREQYEPARPGKNQFAMHRHVPKIHYLLARVYAKSEAEKMEKMRRLLLDNYLELELILKMQLLLMRKDR